MPRWGFPLLAWRWPLALPGKQRADPAERVVSLAATAVSTLWIMVGLAVCATGAEAWRYALLLRSRYGALPATELAISDALVVTMGVMTWLFGLLAGVVVVLWALRARAYAHECTGQDPARSDWQFLAGVLVPGVNLFVPGSVLAELEHAALAAEGERDRRSRPRPSRLVLLWWVSWCASLVLGWVTFLWGFRTGVQALADGVVLHAVSDALAAVLAVITVFVVRYLTRLLTPPDPTALPRMRVREVRGAPTPGRAERPPDAAR